MNANRSLLALLSIAALCTGCVNSGPGTRNAAAGGTAVGAIGGALIEDDHDSTRGGAAREAPVSGSASVGMDDRIDHQRGMIYSEADAQTTYAVSQPPPLPAPPRERVTVRPAPETVWIEGYYAYTGGNHYEWVPGHWEVPPPRYRTFVRPRWEQRGDTYVYYRGYWR